MTFKAVFTVAVLALACGTGIAQAAPTPGTPGPATVSGYIYKNPYTDNYPYNQYQTTQPLSDFGTITNVVGQNSSTLTVGASPTPFVSSTSAGSYVTFSTLATVAYQVVVNGPLGMTVPLQIHSILTVGGSTDTTIGGINARAKVSVHADQTNDPNRADLVHQLQYVLMKDTQPYGQAGTLDTWDDYAALAGDVLGVSVYAETDIYIYDNKGTASALADPYFRIDPAFLAQHPEFSLSFSPGVSNLLAAPVPEPATWALLIFGLGLTGAALRRQRRSMIMLSSRTVTA